MEKFIRTSGGTIWQLGSDGNYHKPGVNNFVRRDDPCVVAASDEMYKLIRVGDLVKFKNSDLKIREVLTSDILKSTNLVSKTWQFDAIYVPVTDYGVTHKYTLEAIEIAGQWCAA